MCLGGVSYVCDDLGLKSTMGSIYRESAAEILACAKFRMAILDNFEKGLFMKNELTTIDIGIPTADRTKIAEGLSRLLADSYTLYLKTHNFHWNVTGPMFQTLHVMFETQYTELALAVDLIAERIRALGLPAPGTYHEFAKLTSIKEPTSIPNAREMILQLVAGQEAVVKTARSIFPVVETAHDEVTADLLTQRMQLHEKTAWMLRSLLEG
jgi:starvation-inducible DNA-binding protein